MMPDGTKLETHDQANVDSSSSTILRVCTLICSVISAVATWFSYKYQLCSLIQRNLVNNTSNFKTLGWRSKLCVEILFRLLHVPPIFIGGVKIKNQESYIYIGWNQVITILMLPKLYLLFSLLSRFSKYQSDEVGKLWYSPFKQPQLLR